MASLTAAEDRLRALGLTGRAAYAALCRNLASRLGLPRALWLEGPDAPPSAALEHVPLVPGLDLFGLAYERFFPDVFKGARGQFFTPGEVIQLTVGLCAPAPGERILDPTCGAGAFLVAAARIGADVHGIELDPELVGLARLNLALAGIAPDRVRHGDLFRERADEQFDVILANPPFSVEVTDRDALRGSELASGRARMASDVLFLEAAWTRLRPGGRLAAVMPYSLLVNPRFAAVREWLSERFVRRAVVTLPEGVFRPFGGAAGRAAVLVLQRRPAEAIPWVAACVQDPGYDPRRRSYTLTGPGDIPALLRSVEDGTAPTAPAGREAWTPPVLDGRLRGDRPRVGLPDLVRRAADSNVRPARSSAGAWTEVDLADVDKQTGEVRSARASPGSAFRGVKTAFEEGDLIFGRIRPSLNNVALVRRPDPALPARMCGSSEWIRLRAAVQPHFALLVLRSRFVREQLRDTGGQTRPRIRAADLDGVQVPCPPTHLRARLDAVVEEAHATRLAARRRLDAAAAAYEAWGEGALDDAGLEAALDALEADIWI
ncbi:MAG: N-6 DNA methylase [Myxococcota bacterium]|nr:N-6 DNA methylase [Myxococcota bacterium]